MDEIIGIGNASDSSNVYCADRALAAAVLEQAAVDVITQHFDVECSPKEAWDFIDHENVVFSTYCSLLGFDPEYVARKMRERINRELNEKVRRHRKQRYSTCTHVPTSGTA